MEIGYFKSARFFLCKVAVLLNGSDYVIIRMNKFRETKNFKGLFLCSIN